jgi:hypothetical protein
MKKANLIYTLTLAISINSFAQAPTKENIYTLKDNESIVYGENCFSFSDQGRNIFIVIKGDDGYYTIDNGIRKGPFKEMNDNLIKPCNQSKSNCAVYELEYHSEENIYDKYITTNEDGTFNINFSGKTFGPFAAIHSFQISSDKSKFVAAGIDKNLSKIIILSTGKTIPIEGLVQNISFSPNEDFFIAKVGFDFTNPNLDPSKINMEQMSAFSIMTSDGIKFGPFSSEKVTDSDIWFTKTTGNHWFLKNGDNLLLDGKTFIKMPEGVGRCDLWFSSDCKRYAISNYEKIKFSDGSTIPYPTETTLFFKEGKAYLRCITLENEHEINVYTKAL